MSSRFQPPRQFSLTPLFESEDAPSLPATPKGKSKPPVFRIQLVREPGENLLTRPQFDSPDELAKLLSEYLEDADREHFVVVLLDTQMGLIGLHTASIGTLNAALVSAREIFKAAILANAASIVVGHNHPSGDPEPSPEDLMVTRVLRRAGAVLDIEVVDHIVIGDSGRFVSLKRRGHFTASPEATH